MQHTFALTSALPAAAVQVSRGRGRGRSQRRGRGGGHGHKLSTGPPPVASAPLSLPPSEAPAPEPIAQPVYPANHNWNPDCRRGTIQGPRQFFFERNSEVWEPRMQQQRAEQEQVEAAKLHHSYIIDTSKPNPTSQRAQELVLLLCEGTEGNLNNRQCQNWVKYMKALGSNAPWEEGRQAFAMDNLSSLLARCERSHHHAHAAEFTKMLSQVQLVIKVDRYVV